VFLSRIALVIANKPQKRYSDAMNWPNIISDLMESGMTQAQIADAVDTGQSHISGLRRGDRKIPNWQLGDRLIRLHAERCYKDHKQAA
jgi:hypothetical protein